jgi:HlyD family secretion protein
VSRAQQQLVAASTALDTLLAHEASAPTTTPSTTPSTGSQGSGTRTGSGESTGQSGSTSRSANGSGAATSSPSTSSPSASDLAAYQKAVDAAAADVAVAEQAIAQATIVSPIAGTVQAVDLAVGDTVSAGSTTANIVVVGAGGFEVTTTVSVDQVPQVQVGQPATFLPDGSKHALGGKVTSIALAPTTSSGATSYHVVVGLDDPGAALNNGSTGSVAIVTKTSRAALAVPTSAVTAAGTRHTVTVLDGDTPTRTLVQVGVVGDTWTEITGGVHAGQTVVLADRDEPLPGSATSSSNGSTSTNGPSGFTFPPGGATFPGGFGGGNRTG